MFYNNMLLVFVLKCFYWNVCINVVLKLLFYGCSYGMLDCDYILEIFFVLFL